MNGTGRYGNCAVAILPPDRGFPGAAAGTAYLLARISPRDAQQPPLARHRVVPGDRLDLIAHRYYGDPAGAWRICDANAALDPEELVGPDAVGTVLVIPVPGPEV